MKIYNMGKGDATANCGAIVTIFDFHAINMGENKYILNSKHKSFSTEVSIFKKQIKSLSFSDW